ncbi:20715_t:CDS:2 [Cetraspora pellucida]|uniref:20715_t:CDS:1 n=1 Tax=Cetraspora pellucida TaxID=1433469 RepID=A0A9N9H9C0_9GLOM|nr:20715_t:CDS:2 [Cetraspora pellucida]
MNNIFAFVPVLRCYHTATLINNKLYFSGGYHNSSFSSVSNDFFYLDVYELSVITNNTSMPWTDLTYTGGPKKGKGTTGINNDEIFIIGGHHYSQALVNRFNTNEKRGNEVTTNDLWIFNSLTLSRNLSNATNAPEARNNYFAVCLPDENIVYIGGRDNNLKYLPMNILECDGMRGMLINKFWILSFIRDNKCSLILAISDIYSYLATSDQIPSAPPDGLIIIFGGINNSSSKMYYGDLWILDASTYKWSIGNILNPEMGPSSLYGHTATIVGNYMVLAFGRVL